MSKRSLVLGSLVVCTLLFQTTACKSDEAKRIESIERALARFRTEEAVEKAAMRPLDVVIAEAEKGDVLAQFELGKRYEKGILAPEDSAQADAWYQKAAAQGHATAQSKIATKMLMSDVPLDEDGYRQAFELFQKAAEGCDNDAQWMLFYRYYRGNLPLHTEKVWDTDEQIARKWGEAAAKNGHGLAMGTLGLALVRGDGLTRDTVGGLAWRYVAQAVDLANAYDTQYDEFEKQMTDADIEKAKSVAHEIVKEIQTRPCTLRAKS